MNVLIVDDEANNRALVEKLLDDHSFVKEVKTASSAIEAMLVLKTFKADVLFLDVEMPGGTGFNFLEALPEQDFKVIFITAHEKYAIEAIRAKAYDYLLKPIDIKEFNQVVSDLAGITTSAEKGPDLNERIIVSTQEETFFLKQKNITKITGAGNYCIYHLANGKEIVASYVLKKASEGLSKKIFVRVHNSSIININFIDKITKIDGNTVVMKDGSEVPVSRRRKEEFMAQILNS